MNTIIDIHTHNPLAPNNAILSVEPTAFNPQPGRYYSVGIHPWNSDRISNEILDSLSEIAQHPQVVAVGETGLDSLRGASLDRQIEIFKAHIIVATNVCKPVVAHMVRTSQQLIKAWRDISPQGIALIVHGMRGNDNVARNLVDAGCYLSFGAHFNPAALRITPLNRILAETDEAPVSIEAVIENMAQVLSLSSSELLSIITHNTATLLTP